ncbi:MAG: acyltransferase [Cellvibrionaceae bacterium]|nr:acyltransferase [Cellvibrionaceae bacterium]
MRYRAEIDGLRAIAVIPVILFHAGAPGFAGGYVGVDIFFVISGYLITSIIMKDMERQSFSLVDFYERRARRIMPALAVVVACTTLAAYLFMPPNYLTQYAQSVVAVMLFAANIYFYLTTNYFATEADEKPLLHTWSLGVEEQFYVFFPLLLMALMPLGRRVLYAGLIALAITSLAFAHFLLARGELAANFFLIFSRTWELVLGALVALAPTTALTRNAKLNQLLSAAGLLAIFYAIAVFDVDTPFPSVYALVPVVGACLLAMFARPGTWAWQLLSQRVLVGIGLISYSLYLWHQPLFSFLRFKWIGEPPAVLFVGAIALTFLLAYLSWKYVEQPFRNRSRYSRQAIFIGSAAFLSTFIVIGLAGHISKGFNTRTDVDYSASIRPSPKRNQCHQSFGGSFDPDKACRYFGDQVTWAVFGDSHMVEPAYALADKLKSRNEGVLHLSYSACPPALLFEVDVKGCHQWIADALSYLEKNQEIHNILLGFRYSLFLYGDQLDTFPAPPQENPSEHILTAQTLNAETARELYWQSLNTMITRLTEAGKKVYVVYPIPELPLHVEKAVFPKVAFATETFLPVERATTADYYRERHQFILQKLDSLPYSEQLVAIKPFQIFCMDGYCPAVRNGQALYFDDDHLSIAGAAMMLEGIDVENGRNFTGLNQGEP